jgi:hypothetical protein
LFEQRRGIYWREQRRKRKKNMQGKGIVGK